MKQDAPSIETTDDAFLSGRVTVRQPVKGSRAAIDALFLSAAIPADAEAKENILEAGTGSAIVSLALAARLPRARLTAIDIEPVMCDLARHNAAQNNFADRITVIQADITKPLSHYETLAAQAGSFHHVLANPPYFCATDGRPSADPLKERAHRADPQALEDWVRFLTAMAAPRASVTLIHAACEAGKIMNAMQGRFGALVLFPLFPRKGRPAKRVIISGIKGSKAPLQLMPGLILHEADGSYTQEADAVLRQGQPLNMRKTEASP